MSEVKRWLVAGTKIVPATIVVIAETADEAMEKASSLNQSRWSYDLSSGETHDIDITGAEEVEI